MMSDKVDSNRKIRYPKKLKIQVGNGKKKYDGEEGGKVDWFLKDALDTVYDPHGTGKVLKPATILARSSEGNVRVRDVVRIYASEGEDGISELAWTSPLTKYIIEAFDECSPELKNHLFDHA